MPRMSRPSAERSPQPVPVPVDDFYVLSEDDLLCATLRGSLVVCLYDAVEECGAMLHLRVVGARRGGLDVSDEVLAADLMLLEHCLSGLRQAMPQARHGQARLFAHCGTDGALEPAASASLEFIRHYLSDAGVAVVQQELHSGRAVDLQFRPVMGQVRRSE